MTHFRFRCKRLSYRRWRCRASRRRAMHLMVPLAAPGFAPSMAAWRCAAPAPRSLRVGDFLITEEGDPSLLGYPDIRY